MAENEGPGYAFINVRANPETHAEWMAALKKLGLTITDVVNLALEEATGIPPGPIGPGYRGKGLRKAKGKKRKS